jgi:putative DNA methylase
LLERTGTFWQEESYDHCVRDEEELLRIVEYIEANPVKARLCSDQCQWPFSSAHDRVKKGIAGGEPLVKS